ncbi:Uncharacterised protein [Mycobacteroides abscessus subsp. abscessus]|nr:Uncharacterised protein [Mycobacteroides abscessus subsp. abscessus]
MGVSNPICVSFYAPTFHFLNLLNDRDINTIFVYDIAV